MAAIIIPVTFRTKNSSLAAEQLHLFFFFKQMNGWNRGAAPLLLLPSWSTMIFLDRVVSLTCLCLASKVPQKQYDQGNQDTILSDDFFKVVDNTLVRLRRAA